MGRIQSEVEVEAHPGAQKIQNGPSNIRLALM